MQRSTPRLRTRELLFVSAVIALLSLAVALPRPSRARDADLSIDPVMQNTPVWCWLAVGEMVFKYFDVPNVNPAGIYQCGIIGTIAGPYSPCWSDCTRCVVGAGQASNITNMLRQ